MGTKYWSYPGSVFSFLGWSNVGRDSSHVVSGEAEPSVASTLLKS